MIRIGVVNIDTSHPLAFSEYMQKGARAGYTAVYNDSFRGEDEVSAFIGKNGITGRYDSISNMARQVDIGFIQSCNWSKHLSQALPFLECGKPVFIDKPIAGSLKDCRAFEKLEESGALILGSSSLRYAREVVEFIDTPVSERGRIISVFGSVGLDEYNYAIHIVEAICALADSDAESVRFAGCGEMENWRCETYFIRFKNGISAVYNICPGRWHPFEIIVATTMSTYRIAIDSNGLYGALLDRIFDTMETGKNILAPIRVLTQSVRIMLAGRLSRLHDCTDIRIDDLSEDDPGYDGYSFEKTYAASAAKIYL